MDISGKQYRFLQAYVDRSGRTRVYVRRKGHRHIPLVSPPGSALFDAEYSAAMKRVGDPLTSARRSGAIGRTPGSLNAGVYFVRSGDLVKIGVSLDVRKRVRHHQVSSAAQLHIMLVMPGGSNVERGLHDRFRRHHVHGEWFKISDDIADFVAQQRLLLRGGK